jgi:multiple sugar transport system permease protein
MSSSRRRKNIIKYILLTILAIIKAIPFYIMIVNATRADADIMRGFSLLPGANLIPNFEELQSRTDIVQAFLNSLFISTLATLLSSYFSALTAYGFVAYDFKFKNTLFSIVLVIMMIPPQLSIIGFYDFMKTIGLLDSYIPLILPSIANASAVFFIRQYAISAIPLSIVESARIDGAGEFRIFNNIGLPILAPAIFTMAINGFIANWNNYLTPLILLFDTDKFTLPLTIRRLQTDVLDPSPGALYLAIAISIIPVMIIFFIFSRRIIGGGTAGSVKE